MNSDNRDNIILGGLVISVFMVCWHIFRLCFSVFLHIYSSRDKAYRKRW